jgi:hypothetical protein
MTKSGIKMMNENSAANAKRIKVANSLDASQTRKINPYKALRLALRLSM